MKGVKVEAKEFTPDLLQQTAELLKKNPEYYTVWNHRRRIFNYEFDNLHDSTASGELKERPKDQPDARSSSSGSAIPGSPAPQVPQMLLDLESPTMAA